MVLEVAVSTLYVGGSFVLVACLLTWDNNSIRVRIKNQSLQPPTSMQELTINLSNNPHLREIEPSTGSLLWILPFHVFCCMRDTTVHSLNVTFQWLFVLLTLQCISFTVDFTLSYPVVLLVMLNVNLMFSLLSWWHEWRRCLRPHSLVRTEIIRNWWQHTHECSPRYVLFSFASCLSCLLCVPPAPPPLFFFSSLFCWGKVHSFIHFTQCSSCLVTFLFLSFFFVQESCPICVYSENSLIF